MIIAESNNKYTAWFIIKLNEFKVPPSSIFRWIILVLQDFNEDVRWIIHHQIGLSSLKT